MAVLPASQPRWCNIDHIITLIIIIAMCKTFLKCQHQRFSSLDINLMLDKQNLGPTPAHLYQSWLNSKFKTAGFGFLVSMV